MNRVPDEGETPAPAEPPASSGEGAGTALEALIRKRKLRADDDTQVPPPADDLELGRAA